MLYHHELQRILLLFENNYDVAPRIRSLRDVHPLKSNPHCLVPAHTPGTIKTAQLLPVGPERVHEYLWMSVAWHGVSLKPDKFFVIAHYEIQPEHTIWHDPLYAIPDFELVDIVTKEHARKNPLVGQKNCSDYCPNPI